MPFCLLFALCCVSLAQGKLDIRIRRVEQRDYRQHKVPGVNALSPYPSLSNVVTHPARASVSTCSICIQAAVLEINILANEILNGVIVDSCEELCNYLAPYGEIAVMSCNAVCIGFGLDEFISYLENEDLDPIWYCEILDMCTIDDCQGDCLDIPMYVTQPDKIPFGGTVNQYFTVWIKKPWNGTGMFRFIISDPVQGVQEDDELIDGGFGPVGKVTYELQIPTAEAQLTQNVTIQTQIMICNGECGSSHPHSRIFADPTSSFMVTPEST